MLVGNLHISRGSCDVTGGGREEEGGGVRRIRNRRKGGIVAEGMSYNLLGAKFSKIKVNVNVSHNRPRWP
jgi:hypothetical protein